VFAFSSWLLQKTAKKVKESGSKFWSSYSRLDVVKHTLHKEYIHSNNIQLASFGATIALLQACRWLLLGILILVFFFGIHSIINRDWLLVASYWFAFNCVLEARNLVKDTSDPKHISHVPVETANGIIESLKPSKNNAIEADKK
tara:strand:- start:1376 stop:1807 length:432 start_codon:yes stop_codon:yes gene_type:complete